MNNKKKIFDHDIVLKNSVVRIRPITEVDLDGISDIAFEPNIWTYFVYKISNHNDLKDYIKDALLQRQLGSRYTFVIENINTHKILGSTALGNYSEKDQRIEIGWSWLGREFQGSDINKNTKYLLLSFLLEHVGLERIEFKTDILNQKARRGLLNIGATEEGVLRSHTLMPDGRRRDTIYYSILRQEWLSIRSRIFSLYSDLQFIID